MLQEVKERFPAALLFNYTTLAQISYRYYSSSYAIWDTLKTPKMRALQYVAVEKTARSGSSVRTARNITRGIALLDRFKQW